MTVTKRNMAPRFWPIHVKEKKYVISPAPGPHNKKECVPILIALRDFLKIAQTAREAREILNNGVVRVNGTPRRDLGFPLGLMDILEIDGDFYRVVPSKYGLKFVSTDEKDGEIKLGKIVNKTYNPKKKLYLNLHDGTNMLVEKDSFKTNDTISVNVKTGKIVDTMKFDKGSMVVVTDGNNRGLVGKIDAIDKVLRTITVSNHTGSVLVPLRYVFVVGHHSKPEIKLGE